MESPGSESLLARVSADVAAASRLAVLHVGIEAGLLRFLRASDRPFGAAELGRALDLDVELTAAWCRAAIQCGFLAETIPGTVRAHPSLGELPLDAPGELECGEAILRIAEDLAPLPALLESRKRVPPDRHGEAWLDVRASRRLFVARVGARAAAAAGLEPRDASVDGLEGETDLAWLRLEIPVARWRLLAADGHLDLLIAPGTLHEVSAALQAARVLDWRSRLRPGGALVLLEPRDEPVFALGLAVQGRAPLAPERARALLAGAGFATVRSLATESLPDYGFALLAEATVP